MATRDIIFAAGPPTLIYKTQRDYSEFVPVTMNDRRTEIISYPSPKDIFYRGILAKPTPLKDGYWLDNRGINENTVFTKYTYEEYSNMETTPDIQHLKNNILDKYPFTEMIDCGIRTQYNNEVEELNRIIDSGFKGCKKLKINKIETIVDFP